VHELRVNSADSAPSTRPENLWAASHLTADLWEVAPELMLGHDHYPRTFPPQERHVEPSSGTSHHGTHQHRISFQRSGHTWCLQWQSGDEETLIDTIAALAADPKCPLDTFDQALVEQHLQFESK
jgi:hypothetical protein